MAERLRQCSDLPVVDIRVTAQELGVMIQQAKVLTMKTPPTIAIVGTASMFCDYCRLSELLHVTLTSYLIAPDDPDPSTSLAKQTELAVRDHVDAIIGGTIACSVAQAHSVPSIFLSSTLDSLQEGLRNAKRMAYAIDQISDLVAAGVDGIHLYTMNNPAVARQISDSVSAIRRV